LMALSEVWYIYCHLKRYLDDDYEPEADLPESCCYQFDVSAVPPHCADHLWVQGRGLSSVQFWVDIMQGFLHGWNIVILYSLIRVIELGGTGDEMVSNTIVLDICHIDTPSRLVASSFCWRYTLQQGIVCVSGLIFFSAVINATICVLRLSGFICQYGTDEFNFWKDETSDDLEWKYPYCVFVISETWLSLLINFLQWKWRSKLQHADHTKTLQDQIFKALVVLETILTMFMASAAFMIAACYYPAYSAGWIDMDGCIYFWRIFFLIWLWWLQWSLHYVLAAGGTGYEKWETVVDLIRVMDEMKLEPGGAISDESLEDDKLEELLGGDEDVKATGSEDDFLNDLLGGDQSDTPGGGERSATMADLSAILGSSSGDESNQPGGSTQGRRDTREEEIMKGNKMK